MMHCESVSHFVKRLLRHHARLCSILNSIVQMFLEPSHTLNYRKRSQKCRMFKRVYFNEARCLSLIDSRTKHKVAHFKCLGLFCHYASAYINRIINVTVMSSAFTIYCVSRTHTNTDFNLYVDFAWRRRCFRFAGNTQFLSTNSRFVRINNI